MSLILKCKQLSLLLEDHRIFYNVGFSIYEVANIIFSVFYRIFWIFKIKNNKIVFSNISGRGYGESPKYIAEEMLRQEKKYDLVWLVNKDEINNADIPNSIRIVCNGSIRSMYELATAKVWIDNTWKLPYIRKRRKQVFIQTWHGCPIKKIIKNPEKEPKLYISALKKCSKMTDLYITITPRLKEIYRTDFWFDGEVLDSGFPKNDLFFSNRFDEINTKVRNKLKIPFNKKIVIYAPTYRQDLNTDAFNLDINKCLSALTTKFGGEWIFLLKLHPLMKNVTMDYRENDFNVIIDASDYIDMQELLYTSDVLITDYSGIIFDYILMGKVCLSYASDINEYTDKRGFSISIDTLPIPIAKDNSELIEEIMNLNEDLYVSNIGKYLKENNFYDDGYASSRVLAWIENKLNR